MSLTYPDAVIDVTEAGRSPIGQGPMARLRRLLGDLTMSDLTLPVWTTIRDATGAHVPDVHAQRPVLPSQTVALREVKALSGLTWDQLGQLFGVSRRSMHNWTNGQPMTQAHEDALHRLREIVQTIGDPNPLVVRSRLRDRTNGASIASLVAEGRLDDALTMARGGVIDDVRALLRAPSRPLPADTRRSRDDSLPALDLVHAVEKGDVPRPGLKKSTAAPRRRPHGGG